jgi:hypothetical protein
MKFKEWKLSKIIRSTARKAGENKHHGSSGFSLNPSSSPALSKLFNWTGSISPDANAMAREFRVSSACSDSLAYHSLALCSQVCDKSHSDGLSAIVTSPQMFRSHNSSKLDATVDDDIMLPPIEDEAWKELEKEVDQFEPMDTTENNPTKSELSQSASPSSPQNCTDSASSASFDRSTECVDCLGSAYQQSAVEEIPQQDITTDFEKGASLNKNAGKDIPEDERPTTPLTNFANKTETETLEPKVLDGKTSSALSNALEDLIFDDLMSWLVGTPDDTEDGVIAIRNLVKKAPDANMDGAEVAGIALGIKEVRQKGIERRAKEPIYRPNSLGSSPVAHWICHLCHAINNAALCDERCISCPHELCIYCSRKIIKCAARPYSSTRLREDRQRREKMREKNEQWKYDAWGD